MRNEGVPFWWLLGRIVVREDGNLRYLLSFGNGRVARRVRRHFGFGGVDGGTVVFCNEDALVVLRACGAPEGVVEGISKAISQKGLGQKPMADTIRETMEKNCSAIWRPPDWE